MRALSGLMLFLASVTAGVSAPRPASASRVSDLPPVQRAGSSSNPLLTQDQVDSWIVKWQKRLDLEDWQIESKIVRVYELPENAVANIHWSLPKKTATIRVLNS